MSKKVTDSNSLKMARMLLVVRLKWKMQLVPLQKRKVMVETWIENANWIDEKSDSDEVLEKGVVEKEETEDEMIRRVAMEAIRKKMETFVWTT